MKIANKSVDRSKFRSDDRIPIKNESESSESKLFSWIGLEDFSEARKAYQEKDYVSALNSAGLGSLKMGTIAAACYGIYKGATGDSVYFSDLFTQAEQDFSSQSHRPIVPASVVKLTESMYNEQKTFAKWPKSGREFAAQHLSGSSLMSSAIIKHLLETAASKGDRTFERYAIKTCQKAASTSQSCLTAAEFYTGASHPKGLRNAMSLLNKCRKNPTAFCKKALENALTLSIDQKSVFDIISLAKKLNRLKADESQSKRFIERAVAMFDQEIGEMRAAVADCEKAKNGDPAAGAICYQRANRFETVAAWAAWVVRKSDLFKKEYAAKQAVTLRAELNRALPGYLDFAKVCAEHPNNEHCQNLMEKAAVIYHAQQDALKLAVKDCDEIKDYDYHSDHNHIPEDSWNRCFSHAGFWEKLDSVNFRSSPWWQASFARRKADELRNELKSSVAVHGIKLAEVCSKFPSSLSCRTFTNEIVQQLFDADLSHEAVKLVGSMQAFGPILDGLVEKSQWGQAVSFIVEFSKKNPGSDINDRVASFWNLLKKSDEGKNPNAYRGYELLSVNDKLDHALEKAFEKKDEDHLHQIYTLAKTWIEKKDAKYKEHLKFIIRQFFANASPAQNDDDDWRYGYHYRDRFEEDMAKVLVTKWIQSVSPKNKFLDLKRADWRLTHRPNSYYDRFSNQITKANWESQVDAAITS